MPNDSTMTALSALLGGQEPSDSNATLFGSPAVSAQDARTAALLQALSAVSEPQRGGSGALGGLGAIARAAGPILGAPAAGREIQRESQMDSLKQKLTLLALMARLQGESSAPTTAEGMALQKLGPNASIQDLQKMHLGFQAPPVPGSLEERVFGNPLDALKYKESQRRADMMSQSDLISQRSAEAAARSEAAAQSREAQKETVRTGKKISTVPGGKVAINPVDLERMPGATIGDVESGSAYVFPTNDANAITQAKEAFRQLNEIERLANKLLPDHVPNTLQSIVGGAVGSGRLAAARAARDPDAKKFETLSAISKYPIIQALNKTSQRFPLAEMKDLEQKGVTAHDSKASAAAKIDEFRQIIRDRIEGLGLEPSILENAVSGGAQLPSAITDRMNTAPKTPVKFESVP